MAEEQQTQTQTQEPETPPHENEVPAASGEAPAETQTAPTFPATEPPPQKHYWWGTGRRKSAVARVRMRPGTGKFLINGREIGHYFSEDKDRQAVVAPLETTSMVGQWDIWVNVNGGGFTGQAGAVLLGLARAIAKAVPDAESLLRSRGLLTRDARIVERKKYGQPGARKRFQFSKR